MLRVRDSFGVDTGIFAFIWYLVNDGQVGH